MARLSRLARDDLPEEHRHLLDSRTIRPDGTFDLYRLLAHNPAVLRASRGYGPPLREGTGLSPRRRELVILAVARQQGSRYEWHQHVRHARGEWLSGAEIRAIARGDVDAFDDPEATLLRYVARYVRMDVDDDLFDALVARFDASTVVGISMLASRYAGLALAMDALGVETEEPFVGWDLDRDP